MGNVVFVILSQCDGRSGGVLRWWEKWCLLYCHSVMAEVVLYYRWWKVVFVILSQCDGRSGVVLQMMRKVMYVVLHNMMTEVMFVYYTVWWRRWHWFCLLYYRTAALPPHAHKAASKELRRLKKMPQHMPEHAMIRSVMWGFLVEFVQSLFSIDGLKKCGLCMFINTNTWVACIVLLYLVWVVMFYIIVAGN